MVIEDTLRSVSFTLLRWISFTANGFLFGSLVIVLLVLHPAIRGLTTEDWGGGIARMGNRIEGLTRAALLASFSATALALLLQAALVAELRGAELEADAFSSVVDTNFGWWYALRFPLLAGLAVLLLGRIGAVAVGPDPIKRSFLVAWGTMSGFLLLTSSLSGHASVTPGALPILNDLVHQASGAGWFTGVIMLAVVLPDAWRGRVDRGPLDLLAPAVVRFSQVALVSIAIVTLSGTLNSFFDLEAVSDLWTTGYGRVLGLKILVFLGVIALGSVNHFVVTRKLEAARTGGDPTPFQEVFRRTIAAELILAFTILGSTGLLTGLARTKDMTVGPRPAAVWHPQS